MIIWIAINNPPKTNFDVPIPTNFLSLRDQRAYKFSSTTTITTTSKTIFRKTNKQGFLYHLYLLLFIMIGSKYNIFDMFVCKVY